MSLVDSILAATKPRASELIPRWFPSGRLAGNHEYVTLNPTRNDRTLGSFSINLHTGFGHDFATGESFGIIDLYAVSHGVSTSEAIRLMASEFTLAQKHSRSVQRPCPLS